MSARPSRGVATAIAVVWLVGFFFYFNSRPLPILGGAARSAFWQATPVAFDLVDPSTEGDSWSNLGDRGDLLLVACFILLGAWGAGRLLLRAILSRSLRDRDARRDSEMVGRDPPYGFAPDRLESNGLALGLGLSLLSLWTLGCGLAGHLDRWFVGIPLVLAPACELFLSVVRRGKQMNVDGSGAPPWWMVLSAAPFLLAMLLGSMLPSTDFDVREYHLEGPKEFFQAGRITMLPHNVYTSFPFLTEMLSLLGMVVRGDWQRGALAGKLVLMAFQPLTALALVAMGRRWFSPTMGALAALIYLSIPWTSRISFIAYAEGGLSCYLLLTLMAVLLGMDAMRNGQGGFRWSLVAGLLAGSAMACKYTGLVQVVAPCGIATVVAALIVGTPHNRWRRATRTACGFAAGVAITIGPWLLKNWSETGNPVYPLGYSVFGGADWSAELNAKWSAAHSSSDFSPRTLLTALADVTVLSNWSSVLLFGLATLAFLRSDRRKLVGVLSVYVLFLFLAWWGLTHRLDRFWVPMNPVVAFLAAAGATWCVRSWWKLLVGGCVAAALVYNLALITSGATGFNRFHVNLKTAQSLAEAAGPRGIAYLNQMQLRPNDRVLLVGEAQVFDARFDLIYNTVFDESIFEQWCSAEEPDRPRSERGMRDPAEIRATFQEAGVSHVLVNWEEVFRYRTTYGYTDFVAPQRFQWLVEQGILEELPLPPEVRLGFFNDLDASRRAEIDKWGPELKVRVGADAAWVKTELFRVR